jgi:hypothetical protein
MQDTEQKMDECNLWLKLRVNHDIPLFLEREVEDKSSDEDLYAYQTFEDIYENFRRHDYMLFDKKKCLESYPVHSDSSPDLLELRQLFADYKNLHVLVMWVPNSLDLQSESDYLPPVPPHVPE